MYACPSKITHCIHICAGCQHCSQVSKDNVAFFFLGRDTWSSSFQKSWKSEVDLPSFLPRPQVPFLPPRKAPSFVTFFVFFQMCALLAGCAKPDLVGAKECWVLTMIEKSLKNNVYLSSWSAPPLPPAHPPPLLPSLLPPSPLPLKLELLVGKSLVFIHSSIIIRKWACLCVGICTHVQMPPKARRGHPISWSWSYGTWESPDMSAGNQIWVFCKIKECS